MNCPICGQAVISDVCNVCRYQLYVEKNSFIKKLFSKKTVKETSFSEEINNIIEFLKWKYNLFISKKYIARSDTKKFIENEKNNYLFFEKLVKSNDLDTYCKK